MFLRLSASGPVNAHSAHTTRSKTSIPDSLTTRAIGVELASARMPLCSYEVTARSAAPPERVFELLSDATSWPRWAGPIIARSSWEREGEPAPGGVGAIRKLGRWPMFSREQVVASEPPSHHAYTILSGNPVRNYRADVALAPDGDGTLIAWSATFEPLIPGTGRQLERVYRMLIGSVAHRLAAYAEQH